jgi:diaminopimelate decarboxylase
VNFFSYRNGALCAEKVPLSAVASQFGTPCYVYSRAALESAYLDFEQASSGRDVLICYAVKANSNLAVLNLFARLGSGFDIVSGGELARVLAAGGAASKTVFSGVGKSEPEMRAALKAGILCFNVESEAELERLSRVAGEMGAKAQVSLRVNPDVDPRTHRYISTGLRDNKFGIPHEEAPRLLRRAASLPGLQLIGIGFHIGSQITEIEPFVASLNKILDFVDMTEASGVRLRQIDVGGGLGIRYRDEQPPAVKDLMARLLERMGHRKLKLLLEPGRVLVGNAGVLLAKIEYLKYGAMKNFAVVDAAMNDLLRPALYDAWQEVLPVTVRSGRARRYDVVGPVCESADFLARDRDLILEDGDLIAIASAGAYGMSMSSNYNSRPRAAEVIVDGEAAHLVRERERAEHLFASERLLP